MKTIFKVLSSALIICLVPFSMAFGQEAKNEQKIKITIDDGTGEETVLDTSMNVSMMTDSLKLNNGEILYFRQSDDETDLKPHEVNKQVFVTVSDDGKETKKVVREIRIVNSDSASESGENTDCKVISDKRKADNEKTKYIITRNGMVITIEGDDYNKVKELVKEIENKLDDKNAGAENINTDKEEQKRGAKKSK